MALAAVEIKSMSLSEVVLERSATPAGIETALGSIAGTSCGLCNFVNKRHSRPRAPRNVHNAS